MAWYGWVVLWVVLLLLAGLVLGLVCRSLWRSAKRLLAEVEAASERLERVGAELREAESTRSDEPAVFTSASRLRQERHLRRGDRR